MVEEVVLELVFNMEGILVAVVDSAVDDDAHHQKRRNAHIATMTAALPSSSHL